ncbi:host attachment family protein [Xanthomonas sp. NCPPB 2654]|uniref:host attachment family protein n=1 Tax=unclassified Xanthomonas TaxID=2643310 RepID=UPI0021E05884|nr:MULTISPECIES: host attachment family protein [unclassified Xanthomonas]MDL5368191.1 host attachment family protein [Xanthomonas sp. NCPPB 2654]MDR6673237.1 protein required for attachment to host cells [Xanthomonas translucens]MEB1529119.1 host attachment family protein [Xanthomonas campestris pv. campestris]UYC21382.1 host attachment family protein [Xanthomonas sp. CFBP 8443]
MSKLPDNTLVVVADRVSARLFRTTLAGETSLLEQTEVLSPTPIEGVEDGDRPMTMDEAGFVRQLAERLYQNALRNDFEHLVLVADPQTLGQLRPLLHKEVQKRVVSELAKNHAHTSRDELEKLLA